MSTVNDEQRRRVQEICGICIYIQILYACAQISFAGVETQSNQNPMHKDILCARTTIWMFDMHIRIAAMHAVDQETN